MFWTLDRWGHSLPGLRTAQGAGYLMFGVIGLVLYLILLMVFRKRGAWLLLALGATAMWTWFCGITIFLLWWGAELVGRWGADRLRLAQQTIPAYWIVGCLFIWTVYIARRMWGRRTAPFARGFPVITRAQDKK